LAVVDLREGRESVRDVRTNSQKRSLGPRQWLPTGIFRKVKCTLRPHYVQSAVIRSSDVETSLDSYAIRFLSVEPSIEELSKKRNEDIWPSPVMVTLGARTAQVCRAFSDGTWVGHWDCRMQPNWLLLYKVTADALILVRPAVTPSCSVKKQFEFNI